MVKPSLLSIACGFASLATFAQAPAPRQAGVPQNYVELPASNAANAATVKPKPFDFEDGDRVMLLGDTLIEREQTYGYVEQRILSHFPGKKIIFRNLGWSADTPTGRSRVSFDWKKSEQEWFDNLTKQIATVKPTVAILGYGMAASFDGETGLPKFTSDLNRLVAAIKTISPSVRLILLSPVRHENLGEPLPDPTEHNKILERYSAAIEEIARQHNARFVPLFASLRDGTTLRPPRPLTDNGIHPNDYGYWRIAEAIEQDLGWEPNWWRLGILANGSVRQGSTGIEVSALAKTSNHVSFTGKFAQVVNPGFSHDETALTMTPRCMLQFLGLTPGRYRLSIDGKPAHTFSAAEWARGQVIRAGIPYDRAEELRETILKKNELYFYRWRPENMTYLFGFRRHEQGQNAKEIPMFDPLVSGREQRIAELVQPAAYKFELTKISEDNTPVGALASIPEKPAPAAEALQKEADELKAGKPLPLPEFELPPGFEISLFAENPLLAKPIHMNFDPQGRLWIVSSSVYPQIEPGQTADDKVLIVEDTDGDGKADKSIVFADGLLIPTGIEPGDGGAYVGQSTKLLFFKDTDGDGKADEKKVVLSAFGTEDTHHIVHTLHWGPDGQLYFNQSIYIHTHIETPHGVERLNSGGLWHLRPDTLELGVFLRGFCNPWGHDFDSYGQSFVTDGAGFQGISYGIPGATYFTYADMRRELRSVSPGSYPKFASLQIIESQQFPDDWQGSLITCDFRAHRVVRFALTEQGSGYVTKEMPDLVRSQNIAFRPIDVKLGPDGALYIADWSNPIIQHGEVDFRDPRRDHEHGRIWRVTAKGRPLVAKPQLVKVSNAELLDQLLSPNSFNRDKARRVLTERKKAIAPDLAAWAGQHSSDERALLQALWVYQSIDLAEANLLEKLLAARDGHIRAAATRVLSYWRGHVPDPTALLAKLVTDEHPRVRLEAVRALAEIPSARSADLVLSALNRPLDDFLDYGIWLSINDLASPWIEAIQNGAWKTEGHEKELAFGLTAIHPNQASAVLGQLLKTRPLPRDGSGPWLDLIGKAGGASELRLVFDKVLAGEFDDSAAPKALAALSSAAQLRNAKPAGDLKAIENVLRNPNEPIRAQTARVIGAWKLQPLAPALLSLAEQNPSPAVRQNLFESLRELGGREVSDGLQQLSSASHPIEVRLAAVQTLAGLQLSRAMPLVLDTLKDVTTEQQALDLWRALLKNKGASEQIARGLAGKTLAPVAGKAGLRAARESGRNDPTLILALATAARLEAEEQNLTTAELQQMAQHVLNEGDPAKGEAIFRRAELGCVTCHAIGGVGGKVGPDLTSIGASAPVDYLIESVLYPNRKIKEGYHSVVVETKDNEELTGILVRETDQQLVLRDASNREVEAPKKNIQKQTVGGSLMPSGLLANLSQAEQYHLYRFLAELGKPGPYDASKGNVARLWHLFPETIDTAQFGDERILRTALADPRWTAAFTLVDGRLPKRQLVETIQPVSSRDPSAIYAATRFDSPKAGLFKLHLTGGPSTAAWIDGKTVPADNDIQTDLPAGKHTLVLKFATKNLPEQIRLETTDGTFLTN